MSFVTIEQEIEPILKENEAARCDDMTLYAAYVYTKLQGYGAGWLERVFSDRRFRLMNNIATYGAVGRVRRRLQAKNPELRATPEAKAERYEAEKEYRKYARGIKNE